MAEQYKFSKYFGTTIHFKAYAALIDAASTGTFTTYQRIAAIAGLPPQGSHMGAEVGKILGDIVAIERRAGRPMLSAVCVGVSGKVGPGFVGVAKDLGIFPEGMDEEEFWQQQRDAVYETWA
jgi:hypothetical protein